MPIIKMPLRNLPVRPVILLLVLSVLNGCAANGNSDRKVNNEDTVVNNEILSGKLAGNVRTVVMQARKYSFIPERIVVRAGEKVRLEITSQDVMHGFALPDFKIDRKLPPKKTEVVEFSPEIPGKHYFHCSVYCGPGHQSMRGTVVVLPAEGDKTILKNKKE